MKQPEFDDMTASHVIKRLRFATPEIKHRLWYYCTAISQCGLFAVNTEIRKKDTEMKAASDTHVYVHV